VTATIYNFPPSHSLILPPSASRCACLSTHHPPPFPTNSHHVASCLMQNVLCGRIKTKIRGAWEKRHNTIRRTGAKRKIKREHRCPSLEFAHLHSILQPWLSWAIDGMHYEFLIRWLTGYERECNPIERAFSSKPGQVTAYPGETAPCFARYVYIYICV
jgi:hypothetical protein